ncbi:MAG: hypothetical protein U1F60_05010 [Planctomycetota bacterium]
MNCTTCRFELSQCLDGRLPSGRRAIVMQHAESCAACGQFWTELQAAQQLTLRLRTPRVSPGFREELWERIRAGEGTPEAVFHEPVPTLTKLRYALTGAALAAGLLLGASWLRSDDPAGLAPIADEPIAGHTPSPLPGDAPNGLQPRSHDRVRPHGGQLSALASAGDGSTFLDDPLLASTQRLTPGLLAVETAKQLEQRYGEAMLALQRCEEQPEQSADAAQLVWRKADEFQGLGEVLIDLRNRQRLSFRDQEVDADLRFAVNILRQGQRGQRNEQTARIVVGEALRSSRLGTLSRTIWVAPPVDPREDMDLLVDLTTQRPEVFRQLFFVMPSPTSAPDDFPSLPVDTVFLLHDVCGPSWVAPRSEVDAREMLRILQLRMQNERVKLQIEIGGPR